MKTWEDVWELPLKLDSYGQYIWDKKGHMVAMFVGCSEKTAQTIFKAIVEHKPLAPLNSLTYNGECILDSGNTPFIMLRGWGGLTGIGGYNLPHDEAKHIQDTFAEYIIKQLSNEEPTVDAPQAG